MGSPWSPRPSFAPRCLMWLEPACRYWSTPNFPAQSIKPRDACETRIGGAIRLICNRVRRRPNSLRSGCCSRSAGSTSSACTLFISQRARRLPSCALRGRRRFRSVLKLVHTICISVRKKFQMGLHCVKCAPPIRSRENRERLWQGLKDGIIDLVATDHSPCPPAMKRLDEGSFKTAWGGISSLSLALPVIWTEASRRGFTLTDLTRWMSEQPARLSGCSARKGRIAGGFDADFVIFEPEAEFVVTKDRMHYRHPVSPYLGEKLRGVVKATYLRGQVVFTDGQFCGGARGREIRY